VLVLGQSLLILQKLEFLLLVVVVMLSIPTAAVVLEVQVEEVLVYQ